MDLVVILHQLQAEALRQDLFGQVVAGGAKTSRCDDDVRAGFGDLHAGAEPLGVIPHHGVILDVNADAGEHLRYVTGIGVGDMSQKNLRPDGDDFSVIRSHGSCLLIILSRYPNTFIFIFPPVFPGFAEKPLRQNRSGSS